MVGRSRAKRVWILLAVACSSCTDPIDRSTSRVEVVIDADLDVRSDTVRVVVEVETQAEPGSGWASSMAPRTFKADPDQIVWPIQYKLPEIRDSKITSVSLVATAHDQQGAVVARVQAIRPIDRARRAGVRVHFDTHCFRQTSLCDDGQTCISGQCVSAREEEPATGGKPGTTAPSESPSMTAARDPNAGLAQAGASCEGDARACAGRGSQSPLHCENGVWTEGRACAETERCDGNAGPTLGQCRPIARECANQKPLVPFCDGDTMRVCTDLVASNIRPCADHMRCVQKPDQASCECQPGFVDNAGVCNEATACTNNGGCDTATTCQLVSGAPVCGACPAGYAGRGDEGCQPLLAMLTPSAGMLSPALDRNTRRYKLQVPLLVQNVELRAGAPQGTRITYNTIEVAPGEAWRTPALRLGQQIVDLELISTFGVSTHYEITIERTAAQEAYVKADSPDEGDLFGYSIGMSGDTLVVGSESEDSAPGGDPTNNALENSGAVYTFVRDASGWRANGILKPDDAQSGDVFGESVAIDGDTLVVGAAHANVLLSTGSRNGVAYVYTRKNGAWMPVQRLSASNAAAGDMFGATASLSGSTLAIGALYGAAAGSARYGAVYIFERSGSQWVEKQILTPSVTNQGPGKYACDLQLDGDRLIVGESGKDLTRPHRGSAYIYVRRNGKWAEEQRLVSDTTPVDSQYGWAVALRGDRAVVGAPSPPQLRPGELTSPGEVYIYERSADGWQQTAFLRAPFPQQADYFGAGLALSDSVLAIGMNGERSSAAGFDGDRMSTGSMASGAVYLYTNDSGRWAASTYIKATKPHDGDWFGWQVLLTGDELVAAAPNERSGAKGVNAAPTDTAANAGGAVFVFH